MIPSSTGEPLQDLIFCGPELQTAVDLEEARAYCISLACRHYENFSVLTRILPRDVRTHFAALYAFCRWADDLADETAPDDALPLLEWWENSLNETYNNPSRAIHPVFVALRETVRQFEMPKSLFSDLISAFRQDQIRKEYETRAELLDYCTRSANPVGRMILHLARCTDAESLAQSDAVCTGLQLANFWQDAARDWTEKGRRYVPREDMERFSCSLTDFREQRETAEFLALMAEETAWAETFFERGKPLSRRVPRTFRIPVRLFRSGGIAILNEIRNDGFHVLRKRPKLNRWKKLWLLLCAVCFGN